MKFKIGDTLSNTYAGETSIQRIFIIKEIKDNLYWFNNNMYWEIENADKWCIKINHYDTKLGKVLYK